ncbi:MAG: secretin N-terminal domain-containing protein [Pirellula sp.]
MMKSAQSTFRIGIVFAILLGFQAMVVAQPEVVVQGGGTVALQSAPGGRPTPGGPPPGAMAPPQGAKPDAKPTAKDKDGKPIETAPSATPPGPASITRKSEPPEAPNKREFDVKPDELGMLQFQFRNQAWPDLMRWLAEVSSMSLDWQELPGDYLNIATQRKHTLEEARDLFNRHLLARGFTMLEFDGTIQVLKTAGINAALVPKTELSKLAGLPPNRFVRASFPLNTLIAADVVNELKPLISSNGSLNALASTNRLEAMDTAANLSELNRILTEEQSPAAMASLAQEFELEHVRAMDVREQLLQFLGLETKKAPPTREQQMMEMQQQQAMMQMQQQQQQQGAAANKQKPKAEIYIVANARRNSVIAHAPPDKMAVIAAFVRRVDVPNENADSLQLLEARTQVYRLVSLDPKQLVSTLLAMDAMEPATRLEVDEKNKAIIAVASLSDHFTIRKMIERLDGSARDVDVIQLRRLRAEDVAGTIKFLMGNEEKKEDNSRARSMFFYDPYGSMNSKKDTQTDVFRVAANSQDNQVLIWANEVERAEVRKLLIKLGELPPDGGNQTRVRVVDGNRSDETKAYLKRLQEAWSKISPTPLELPEDSQFEPPDSKKSPAIEIDSETKSPGKDSDKTEADKKKQAALERSISNQESGNRDLHLAILGIPNGLYTANHRVDPPSGNNDLTEKSQPSQTESEKLATGNSDPADVPPEKPARVVRNPANETRDTIKNPLNSRSSIRISFDERGNLVLMSDDTEALSKLEQLMIDNAPPQRGYEVYIIKNSTPSWIKWNLEDYFKEEKKERGDSFYRWLFDGESSDKKDDPQLGKKRKLRFLSDNDTKSLIVIGADDAQLKTIEELIRLWDVPEKTNKQKLRYSKLVQVEFSKAEGIVEAIKDAYRDLLSTNDKAFQKEKEGAGANGKEPKRNDSSESIFDGGMSYSFSGRLSLGVDKATNSIIVSAEGEDLLTLVSNLIKQLDEAAKPNGSVEILKLGGANAQALEKALSAWTKANNGQVLENDPNQQQSNQQQKQNQFQNGTPPSNSDRGRSKSSTTRR